MSKTRISGHHGQAGSESFVIRLTEAQCDLHAYIAYLVGNRDEAMDVLQETNIILWREAARYNADKPFIAWAKSVAYYQALAHLKKKSRDRLVFDEDLLLLLATVDERRANDMQDRLRLLDICFEKLTAFQQSAMKFRYFHGWPVKRLAKRLNSSEAAASMLLTRIRRQLARCIETSLKKEARA